MPVNGDLDEASVASGRPRGGRSARRSTLTQTTKPAAVESKLSELTELANQLASGVAELATHKREARTVGDRFAEEVEAVLGGDEELDDEAIRRGVRLAVAEQAWQHRLGTLLQTRDVVDALGVSRQRVATLTRQHRLVALPTKSGVSRYPAWQFKLAAEQREVAARAHRILVEEGEVSPWTAASWFVQQHPSIDHADPIAAIADGHDDEVLRAARRDAAAVAQ